MKRAAIIATKHVKLSTLRNVAAGGRITDQNRIRKSCRIIATYLLLFRRHLTYLLCWYSEGGKHGPRSPLATSLMIYAKTSIHI